MRLQQNGEKITFGTDEIEHKFKLKRRGNELMPDFKAQEVEDARAALLVAYPDDAERIERYAERLMRMLP